MRVIATALALGLAGIAQADTPVAVPRALLATPAERGQFAPAFLQAVPLAQVEGLLGPLRDMPGPVAALEVEGDRFRAEGPRHGLSGRIALDAEGRVAMLFLEPAMPLARAPQDPLAPLAGRAETVAWLVIRDGRVLAERDADRPVEAASAFKLGALAAPQDAVRDGGGPIRAGSRAARPAPAGRFRWKGYAP